MKPAELIEELDKNYLDDYDMVVLNNEEFDFIHQFLKHQFFLRVDPYIEVENYSDDWFDYRGVRYTKPLPD